MNMSGAIYHMNDVGFYVDHEVAAYILLAADRTTDAIPCKIATLLENGTFAARAKKGNLPCKYSVPSVAYEYYDYEGTIFTWANEFDGKVSTLFPERAKFPIKKTLSDTPLVYVPAAKTADWFKAAYQSPEELLEEFKTVFVKYGINFPDDFDWWRRIVSISGTNFC